MGQELNNRLQEYELRTFMVNLVKDLKTEILDEVKVLLKDGQMPNIKKWIKSVEVKKLLGISHGKLQTMRNSKTISFTRIGGTIYYNLDDIQKMLENTDRKK